MNLFNLNYILSLSTKTIIFRNTFFSSSDAKQCFIGSAGRRSGSHHGGGRYGSGSYSGGHINVGGSYGGHGGRRGRSVEGEVDDLNAEEIRLGGHRGGLFGGHRGGLLGGHRGGYGGGFGGGRGGGLLGGGLLGGLLRG